jgi:hypothetical protein
MITLMNMASPFQGRDKTKAGRWFGSVRLYKTKQQ